MNAQTRSLRKLGLCTLASHTPTTDAKLRNPTVQAVQHGPFAFLDPAKAKLRKEERKRRW